MNEKRQLDSSIPAELVAEISSDAWGNSIHGRLRVVASGDSG